jgi:carbon monoxide dehydrogenase subunit G
MNEYAGKQAACIPGCITLTRMSDARNLNMHTRMTVSRLQNDTACAAKSLLIIIGVDVGLHHAE